MSFLDIATIVSVGMLIGVEFPVSAFLNPVLWKLEDRSHAGAVVRLFAVRLGTAMPFWYLLSCLLVVVEAVVRRHQPGLPLLIASASIWIAVIVFTVLFPVPINNRLARPGPDFLPEEVRREHKRWDALHRLRVVALGAAWICFLLAEPR